MNQRTPKQIEALKRARQVALEAPSGELFDLQYFTEKKSCGTAHCFFGWLAVDPWFSEQGDERFGSNRFCFTAARRLFGIDYREEGILFACGKYSHSRKTGDEAKIRVIHNVDRLIKGEAPLRYRSKTWRTLDLTALRQEVASATPEAAP